MPAKFRQNNVQTINNNSAWLLYVYSIPYLFSLISKLLNGEVLNLVLVSAVFVANFVAAYWMSTGLKNKKFYNSRKYPSNPPFPMMFLASLLSAISCFCSAWLLLKYNIFAGLGFGIAAMVGCWLWYGLDPVKSKHISFSDINDSEKALGILQESETLVINIESYTQNFSNSEMVERLDNITSKAREVLNVLFDNPKKISKARRFLNTYLTGTESVVERYSKTKKSNPKSKNSDLQENFREVLINIEQVFNEQHTKLISSDIFDLDVDIEVLNTLLKKQGIN